MSIKIGELSLESPVMIGAGPIKLPQHVIEIAKSNSAAVIVGSITVKPRNGNVGKNHFQGNGFWLNSKGLPNNGLNYYEENLPQMIRNSHKYNKPLIVSIAGFSKEEYWKLANSINKLAVDVIEVNLGCPNVMKRGKHQPIISFNEELVEQVLSGIAVTIWVKLSPFSDPEKLAKIAKIISKHKNVSAVVSTNTFPNAFGFNLSGKSAIDVADGYGGMSGQSLKPIGLGQVRQLRQILPSSIAVIGSGGIETANDVNDYLKAGAIATQITSGYFKNGPTVFSKVKI